MLKLPEQKLQIAVIVLIKLPSDVVGYNAEFAMKFNGLPQPLSSTFGCFGKE